MYTVYYIWWWCCLLCVDSNECKPFYQDRISVHSLYSLLHSTTGNSPTSVQNVRVLGGVLCLRIPGHGDIQLHSLLPARLHCLEHREYSQNFVLEGSPWTNGISVSVLIRTNTCLCVTFQILCLAGRGLNIGLLTLLANRFRQTKITPQQQFIMWFSGNCFYPLLVWTQLCYLIVHVAMKMQLPYWYSL